MAHLEGPEAAVQNLRLFRVMQGRPSGPLVSGTVAAIESFGVFVALDEGPATRCSPAGASLRCQSCRGTALTRLRMSSRPASGCHASFLHFDTSNGKARLSLRALQPDPVRTFLDKAVVGQVLRGTVTKLVPFGAFVQVADGVEGLAHAQELSVPVEALQVGSEIMVAIASVGRGRRRLALSQRAVSADSR